MYHRHLLPRKDYVFIYQMTRPNTNKYHPIHNITPEDKGEERLERIRDEDI